MENTTHIIGLSSATPIGWNAGITFMSQQSGYARFTEWEDEEEEFAPPITISRADALLEDLPIMGRFDQLATECIKDGLNVLKGKSLAIDNFRVIVALPGLRPGLSDQLPHILKERIEGFISVYFQTFCDNVPQTVDCTFHHQENIAGIAALEEGITIIDNQQAKLCLVLAIDSFISPDILRWLKANDRVVHETNKTGVIPGEASACVLLAADDYRQQLKLDSLGEPLAIAHTLETKLPVTGEACTAEALSEAVETTLQQEGATETIDHIYIDLDGMRHKTDEYGFFARNLAPHLANPGEFVCTLATMGHLGAAYGLVLLNLAIMAGLRGFANGPQSIIITGNETGERAVALVKTRTEELGT